ncbi:N-acetyltransferase [Reticulibacter mediterranei]|uniref:N-acetyltransferase n=1 Tax=Reticulibacter mediterranei TaxID=2778369 RepID=A0A8J3IWP6_9CHLR|nr:GNAT family N-acetyltransferase [Reticulibacter mediterranei]GHO98217.1 N-acetyltransferase [Reticulibacter mediterranei]
MTLFDFTFHHERPIEPEMVRKLYDAVGWWPEREEQEIAAVLSGDLAIGAWDGERLIGFARVISDHRLHAYIDDVMVHPDYQRQGVGRQMLTKLLAALQHIETITLFCQPELREFYRQSGFRAFPSQVVMHQKGNDDHRSQ